MGEFKGIAVPGMDRKKRRRMLTAGIGWYAKYPNLFAGDHTGANAGLGKMIFDMLCNAVAKRIRAVKDDNVSEALCNEFDARCVNPE